MFQAYTIFLIHLEYQRTIYSSGPLLAYWLIACVAGVPSFIQQVSEPQVSTKEVPCGDKKIEKSSYLHNGISSTSKMASLFWISALVICLAMTLM